jgi:hypothetical protein
MSVSDYATNYKGYQPLIGQCKNVQEFFYILDWWNVAYKSINKVSNFLALQDSISTPS